jgi:hypothetical protein
MILMGLASEAGKPHQYHTQFGATGIKDNETAAGNLPP